MKPCAIGLVGYRRSGKSLAAERLHLAHGYVRLPFAKPLKDMLRAVGLTDAHLDGSLKEKPCPLLLGRTPRYAMQRLGTEFGREMIHPDIWLHLWREAVRREKGKPVVAEDVRFPNEADAVRALGGVLWWVKRDGCGPTDHVSETGIDTIPCDAAIGNDGTPDDLRAKVDSLLAAYGRAAVRSPAS